TGVATQIEEAVGNKLRRNLTQGTVISLNMLERPSLVKKGDRVLIVAQKGPLKITAPGIVREKGFQNSMVKVENIQSRKIVYARVLSSSMVSVEF
ncbi:MAG: flagellar basal body P-ring formation chaperone FlgA, partial [Nitrospinales bacterium]